MTRHKILVVEDNLMNVRLLKAVLREPEFNVVYAGSAEEAFETLEERKPDLILMDLGLPGMDGFEAIRKLKEDATHRSIPVVAVSAFARSDEQEKARRAGASAFISKPIDVRCFPLQILEHIPSSN